MTQTSANRRSVVGTSLLLLSVTGLFAALAQGQPPYGQPQPTYQPTATPNRQASAYAPPYRAGPPAPRYQPGPAPGARYPLPGQPAYPPQAAAPTAPPYRQQMVAPVSDPLEDLFTPAKIVARVGDQPILAGDLMGDINQMLEPYVGKAPQEELDKQKVVLMRSLLSRLIETKLVYIEFLRTAPAEQMPTIEANLAKAFDEEQLGDLIKRAEVATAAELDAKLRGYGTSLEKQRKRFGEQYIAQMVVRRKVDYEPEITHREMLDYYQEHIDEYSFPAKVKWEHLMASFEKHGTEQATYQAIAAMGNEVVGGAPLEAVAKRSSDAADSFNGGLNESSTQGSLIWKEVDATLFSIPPNRLSTIVRSNDGFHIVRVLERTNAGRESFVEAQVEIRNKLKKEKIKAQADAFLAKLRAATPVWTIFDDLSADVADGQSYQELMRR